MAVKDAGVDEEEDEVLYLAKCVHRSSVVVHAACGHIRSPSTLDVVFGKETALELVVLAEDASVQSVCEQPVFGAIKDMKLLPWNQNCRSPQLQTYGKDLVVLLSDSGKLSFLTFSVELHRFLAISHVSLSHPGRSSLRELGWLLAAESRGRAVAVAAFEDQVAVFPASIVAGNNVVEKGMNYPSDTVASAESEASTTEDLETPTWGTIWSMTFVSSPSDCSGSKQGPSLMLAVLLHRRGALSNELQLLACEPKDKCVRPVARYNPSGDPRNSRLTFSIMEVPAFPGHLLLFRIGDIMLVDASSNDVVPLGVLELADAPSLQYTGDEATAREKPSVCSSCWEPDTAQPRLAFSLNTGSVFLAHLRRSDSGKPTLSLDGESYYKCSPCKVLLWSKGGFLAAMVEMGDGLVLNVGAGFTCQGVIQNIAPIIDFSLVDYHGDKQDQVFACCGAGQEGSLRVIRNGNRVEKLISTPAAYDGVSAVWTVRISFNDPYHAFFIISFVEQTRVLSVGLNFVDVTDAVGIESSTNTLACGLVEDNWVAQVHSEGVRLCCPTQAAHPSGTSQLSPNCTSWEPTGFSISVGAVSRGKLIVALSRPGLLVLLGTKYSAAGLELVELQHCLLDAEVSCISIPEEDDPSSLAVPPTMVGLHAENAFPAGLEVDKICIVGTHRPSVEVLSTVPGDNFSPLAVASVSSIGTGVSGCIPQDVRLALFDRPHILAGLRNGMLLRYEWLDSSLAAFHPLEPLPSSSAKERPAQLQLIAIRRLGVVPVFLVPLKASLRSDIIALSDRPWLLQTARHNQRISYSSISFQPSTHATPVCSPDCPNGVFFMADNSLHLVEMEQSRALNIQKLHLGTTPRRVVYHAESKTLVLLQTETTQSSRTLSRLSCVDPISGDSFSSHSFGNGEVAKCMQLMKFGSDQLLLVGTALSSQRALLPTGEPESAKGHLLVIHLEPRSRKTQRQQEAEGVAIVFPEDQGWELTSKSMVSLPGAVLACSPYLDQYVLASAGNSLFCLGFTNEGARLKRITAVKTRFLITNITVHFTTIAVGDCRDGLILYTFREDTKKLEQLECDPMQRLIADCIMLDSRTAAVMDRSGNFCALSSTSAGQVDPGSPERNLAVSCWFHLGEISRSIRKGSLCYKASVDDKDLFPRNASNSSVIATTMLGSVYMFIPVSREEYELLEAVQAKLAVYTLTAPVLGNSHARFRGQGCPANVKKALDGDMLAQFLELTSVQQFAVLKEESTNVPALRLPLEQVLRSLERVHHSLP